MNLFIKIIANLIIIPFILMLTWNIVMVDVFNMIKINYFQAILLKIISNILFKNYQSSERDKKNEEDDLKKDIAKIEKYFEKYLTRLKNIKTMNNKND